MINCERVQSQLPALLSGRRLRHDHEEIMGHIARCPDCSKDSDILRRYLKIDEQFISTLRIDPKDGERMAREIIRTHTRQFSESPCDTNLELHALMLSMQSVVCNVGSLIDGVSNAMRRYTTRPLRHSL